MLEPLFVPILIVLSPSVPKFIGVLTLSLPIEIVPSDEFTCKAPVQSKSIADVFVVDIALAFDISIIVDPFSFIFTPVFPSNDKVPELVDNEDAAAPLNVSPPVPLSILIVLEPSLVPILIVLLPSVPKFISLSILSLPIEIVPPDEFIVISPTLSIEIPISDSIFWAFNVDTDNSSALTKFAINSLIDKSDKI